MDVGVPDVYCDSFAKKAAAFLGNSFSIRASRSSIFNWRIQALSASLTFTVPGSG